MVQQCIHINYSYPGACWEEVNWDWTTGQIFSVYLFMKKKKCLLVWQSINLLLFCSSKLYYNNQVNLFWTFFTWSKNHLFKCKLLYQLSPFSLKIYNTMLNWQMSLYFAGGLWVEYHGRLQRTVWDRWSVERFSLGRVRAHQESSLCLSGQTHPTNETYLHCSTTNMYTSYTMLTIKACYYYSLHVLQMSTVDMSVLAYVCVLMCVLVTLSGSLIHSN